MLDENTDPLIKTAILHAQFESIHPFLNSNGKLARILIVLSIMRDMLLEKPIFFMSEELEKEKLKYHARLNRVSGNNPKWFDWIDFFLNTTQKMASSLLEKTTAINELAKNGLKLIGHNNGVINSIWLYTFSTPLCTAGEIADALDISAMTARLHLNHLTKLKLLEVDCSKKLKIYSNEKLLKIIG